MMDYEAHDQAVISGLEQDLAAARAEIERLTKERDSYFNAGTREMKRAAEALTRAVLAEAERDEARAQVAASYDAVAEYIETVPLEVTDRQEHAKAIRALASDHAHSALEAYGREKVREGMRWAYDLSGRYHQITHIRAAILADMEKEGGE
jgi:hypothetical protein